MATANVIQMERFAFDVFVDTLLRFKLKFVIPSLKCSENTYEHPDFFLVLSRGYITYQLRQRDNWKAKFEAVFESNGLKKSKQVSNLLEKLLEEMDREPRTPMDRVVASLAVINELIQFLYSKNRPLFFNDLARSWRNYFAGFEKEFEEAGGLAHLYSIHCGRLQVYDKILDEFIPSWCHSYDNPISSLFNKFYLDPQSFFSLEKAIDNMASKIYSSSLEEKHLTASRSPRTSGHNATKASDSLVNTGLGIPQHEDLLRDSYSPFTDEGTSPEKPNASPTEETSASAHTNLKSRRKQSGQRRQKLSEERSQPSIQITSPEGQSKERGALTRSSLSPEGQSKERGALTRSSLSPEGQLKERGALTRSSLSPEGQLKERSALPESPLSSEEQPKGREGSTGSPSSQEQKLRRSSPRTPEGTSRLEQKRQKHRKPKKSEPTN